MATQITQIPTQATTYTGTANTYAELVPTNYWPILPITIYEALTFLSYQQDLFILEKERNGTKLK